MENLEQAIQAVREQLPGLKLLENRVYLFVHRYDNVTKRGAEITGGFAADTETVGPLQGKSET